MTRLLAGWAWTGLLAASACAPAGGGDAGAATDLAGGERPTEGAPGRLVIVGGALQADNADVYEAILEAREGAGPVCVLPTASGAPAESMTSAVERLDRWGGPGTAEGVLLTVDDPARADEPDVAARLRRCSGYFFTGGSQSRIVATFRPGGRSTAARDAVMERWRAGAVVAGTSAGAAMMGGRMIAGGSSVEAVAYGVRSSDDGDGVVIEPGMGFFESAWLDQHFLARGRWGRLLVATLRAEPYATGLGIDENTALVVDGEAGRVVGASGVVVLDARGAREAEGGVEGVRLELAGAGDVIDLRTFEVVPAAAKAPWPGADDGAGQGTGSSLRAGDASAEGGGEEPDPGPFPRWGLLRDLARMAETGSPAVYRVGEGRTITLAPSRAFHARVLPAETGAEAAGGPEGTPRGLQVGPVDLSVRGSIGRAGPPGAADAGAQPGG